MAAFITHYDVLEAWGGKLHALCFALDVTTMKNQREAHVMLFPSENGFCSGWLSIRGKKHGFSTVKEPKVSTA